MDEHPLLILVYPNSPNLKPSRTEVGSSRLWRGHLLVEDGWAFGDAWVNVDEVICPRSFIAQLYEQINNNIKNLSIMKKLFLLTILMALPIFASAYDCQVDGIYYNLIPKGNVAEVTGINDYVNYQSYNPPYNPTYIGELVIPDKISYEGLDYTVTTIGKAAFRGCSDLTSIKIPNTIIRIRSGAFSYCI